MRVLLCVILLVGFARTLSACVCGGGEQSVEVASKQVDAVFAGTVVGRGEAKDSIVNDPYWGSREMTRPYVLFRVRAAWKGVGIDTTITILSNPYFSCSYPFKVGESYVVYARRIHGRPWFGTSICDRTCQGQGAKEEWAALGPPRRSWWPLFGKWKL